MKLIKKYQTKLVLTFSNHFIIIIFKQSTYLPLKLPKIHNFYRLEVHLTLITFLVIEGSLQTKVEIAQNNIPLTSSPKKIGEKNKILLLNHNFQFISILVICVHKGGLKS